MRVLPRDLSYLVFAYIKTSGLFMLGTVDFMPPNVLSVNVNASGAAPESLEDSVLGHFTDISKFSGSRKKLSNSSVSQARQSC